MNREPDMASVQVLVLNEKGKLVEKGAAIKKRGAWWEYVPTAEGKVVVEAGFAGECG
jgi:hypothetical protein